MPPPNTAKLSSEELKALQQIVALIRAFLRDYPQLNRLVLGERHSDRSIAIAVLSTMDTITTRPPQVGGLNLSNVPVEILRDGALANLIMSDSLFSADNKLTYQTVNTGGSSVAEGSSQKLSMYQLLMSKFDSNLQTWKMGKNLQAALGGVAAPSEYALLARQYTLEIP